MRKATVIYSIIAIWIFGWLTGTFGGLPALLVAVILGLPAICAWRMTAMKRPVKRREYGYLIVATTLAVVGTAFLVVNWYSTGMDRLATFEREYHAFRRHVSAMPEYKNVEISYTRRKGGRVYLRGTVVGKVYHDQLMQTIESMVRNNDCGYYDGVDYPNKPSSD